MSRLLTLDEAAERLGVKPGSLETVAKRHGFIVKMGRSIRIDPNSLEELIEKCRENPLEPDSTNEPKARAPAYGSSETVDDSCQQALAIADKLKERSRATSRSGTGPPAQVHPMK